MTELKPCPFCGCDVSFYRDKSGWNKVLGNHGDICPLQGSNLLTWSEKEDAPIIEKWNTRTSPWISVKEQLPPFETPIWIQVNGEVKHSAYMFCSTDGTDDWFEECNGIGSDFTGVDDVDAWMPMPKPLEVK